MSAVEILHGYHPGAVGRAIELHGTWYSKHWQFDETFEIGIARGIGEFMARYDPLRDRFWAPRKRGRFEGTLAIDGIDARTAGARLRWVLLSEEVQGAGIGRQMMDLAMQWSRDCGYSRVYLHTVDGLRAARRLYDDAGFELEIEEPRVMWGREVIFQQMAVALE